MITFQMGIMAFPDESSRVCCGVSLIEHVAGLDSHVLI
jgi:hypothetical protein